MDTRYKTIGGERCHNCGCIYKMCWIAPDDLWWKITGSEPGKGGGGLLCPECFDALCAANGISLFWECRRDNEHWENDSRKPSNGRYQPLKSVGAGSPPKEDNHGKPGTI